MQIAIAIAGVAAILGSTGGGGGPASCAFIIPTDVDCSFTGGGGGPIKPPPPPPPPSGSPPTVTITPQFQIAQVGMPVTFEAHVANLSNPTYGWCRAPSSYGSACESLPGIYGPTYTIPSVAMSDNRAWFEVTATGAQGTATSGPRAGLYVSPQPPVVFEDGEFLAADWVMASIADPPEVIATVSGSRMTTGGNPGAFLRQTYDFPATGRRVFVFHSKLSANYYPMSQGAIDVVDFTMECKSPGPLTWMSFSPMLEQGGRRFSTDDGMGFPGTGNAGATCGSTWRAERRLLGSGLKLVDGPACGAGESCPDFSASGAPIRLGFMAVERIVYPTPGVQVAFDYDNWKMTVWRK